MSENKRGEETFLAIIGQGYRVTIYEPVRKSIDLDVGDRVRVTIRKDEARDKLAHS